MNKISIRSMFFILFLVFSFLTFINVTVRSSSVVFPSYMQQQAVIVGSGEVKETTNYKSETKKINAFGFNTFATTFTSVGNLNEVSVAIPLKVLEPLSEYKLEVETDFVISNQNIETVKVGAVNYIPEMNVLDNQVVNNINLLDEFGNPNYLELKIKNSSKYQTVLNVQTGVDGILYLILQFPVNDVDSFEIDISDIVVNYERL